MTEIIIRDFENYSEEFCKYTLYKVALGLSKMHYRNVLHRDIKSDNIFSSETGTIKIFDLGLEMFLSDELNQKRTR